MRRTLRAFGFGLAVVSGVWIARLANRWREPAESRVALEIRVKPQSQPDPETKPQPLPQTQPPATPAHEPMPAVANGESLGPTRVRVEERHPLDLRIPVAISVAIALLAAAFWFTQLRQRTDAATVQQHVALTRPGATIGCLQETHNGSQFSCAVTYSAASECVAVSVSMLGQLSHGRTAPGACTAPQLRALLPQHVTAAGVAADVTRIDGGSRYICARAGARTARFACARRSSTGVDCRVVRVIAWTPPRPRPGGDACRRSAYLRQTVIG